MRCSECVLERDDAKAIELEAFWDGLFACEGCPLLEGERAIPAVRLLVKRHRDAARALRRAGNELRKEQRERADLTSEIARYEARMAALEAVHQKSLEASEREMMDKLRLIEAQKQALLDLSAPVLHIGEGIVAVPVIGEIDDERAEVLREGLLAAIATSRVHHAILDLTGVSSLEESSARHIVAVVQAASLLGARVVVSGVQSVVAQAMVRLGLNLSGIPTVRDLKEALRLCQSRGERAS